MAAGGNMLHVVIASPSREADIDLPVFQNLDDSQR